MYCYTVLCLLYVDIKKQKLLKNNKNTAKKFLIGNGKKLVQNINENYNRILKILIFIFILVILVL